MAFVTSYSMKMLKGMLLNLKYCITNGNLGTDITLRHNLVPRSHSVTGNVRSGKVRQYTVFHWLLKKGCGNVIYAPIGLFRGALSEGLVFASSCAVLNKCQLCGGKFVFSDAGKSLQLRKMILKICDVCVNGTDESPTHPTTRIKFCVACYAVRRN